MAKKLLRAVHAVCVPVAVTCGVNDGDAVAHGVGRFVAVGVIAGQYPPQPLQTVRLKHSGPKKQPDEHCSKLSRSQFVPPPLAKYESLWSQSRGGGVPAPQLPPQPLQKPPPAGHSMSKPVMQIPHGSSCVPKSQRPCTTGKTPSRLLQSRYVGAGIDVALGHPGVYEVAGVKDGVCVTSDVGVAVCDAAGVKDGV